MDKKARLVVDNTAQETHLLRRKSGDEPPGDDMEARVRELEKGHAVVVERINSLERRMDDRFDGVSVLFDGLNKRFDDLNRKIDKLPNEWAMARVVFYVVGALMAAAIFGPRLLSMVTPA